MQREGLREHPQRLRWTAADMVEEGTKAAKLIERAAANESNKQISHKITELDLGDELPWPNQNEDKENEFPLQPFCLNCVEADVADPEEMAEQQELNARKCRE